MTGKGKQELLFALCLFFTLSGELNNIHSKVNSRIKAEVEGEDQQMDGRMSQRI